MPCNSFDQLGLFCVSCCISDIDPGDGKTGLFLDIHTEQYANHKRKWLPSKPQHLPNNDKKCTLNNSLFQKPKKLNFQDRQRFVIKQRQRLRESAKHQNFSPGSSHVSPSSKEDDIRQMR